MTRISAPGRRAMLAPVKQLWRPTFKVAIGERRILAVDAHRVGFRYQKPRSHRVRAP